MKNRKSIAVVAEDEAHLPPALGPKLERTTRNLARCVVAMDEHQRKVFLDCYMRNRGGFAMGRLADAIGELVRVEHRGN